MIDYNLDLLNWNDLKNSFFYMDKQDPVAGFGFDAADAFGPKFFAGEEQSDETELQSRLMLGSHLARHLRHELEEQHGYTATVGISTNKLLSKLVGNVNKPKNQTTLMPPYVAFGGAQANPSVFMDGHEIGKVPGIGFKSAQKIRAHVLERPAAFNAGLVYGGTRENVTVKDVRTYPGMNPQVLENILGGPGAQKGIGGLIWNLLHGIDDSQVAKAKKVPSQISIEDSYIRLDTLDEVKKELLSLSRSLISRMQIDLTEEDVLEVETARTQRRWLAHPRTLRLSTRPRPPTNPDGTRQRSFNRISRSCPLPNYVFNITDSLDSLADRLVHESLVPAFRKLHPEKSGWNLSLVNVAVTHMMETAADEKDSAGRNIGRMFERQEAVLKDFKIVQEDESLATRHAGPNETDSLDGNVVSDDSARLGCASSVAEGLTDESLKSLADHEPQEASWDDGSGDEEDHLGFLNQHFLCPVCDSRIPTFAVEAHTRFHDTTGEKSYM